MRTSDADILFVPGLGNSGPDHWQTRWEKKLSTGRRVEQTDWEHPRLKEWVARLVEEIARSEVKRPAVLIAHSLGNLVVV
ncbi:MAG: serine hydrolase family protein, partial [Hyphomicrobiales bacterium]|nr:serine hydrolase family protein [Hyphomicrobiales bacterium]